MWVEVDHDKVATSFCGYDRIRVEIDNGPNYEGLFSGVEVGLNSSTYVRVIQPNYADYPITLYVWEGRRFYRWEEDKPTSSVGPIDQAKLRLNQPGATKQKTTRCDVQVGSQTYVLAPGDHLRVWWEDGALWSEFVQEAQK